MAPSPPRRRVVPAPAPAADPTVATPAMTLAAVGRPPAAASPSDPGAGPHAPAAAAAVAVPAEAVVPITSFDDYMNMLSASAERVAVLKFFAPWCRSCRAIAPKVARLAHEFPEIHFYEIDYEANKELCWRLGVKNLPTFHFYSGAAGRVEDFNAGPARAHIIREKVMEYALGSCAMPTAEADGASDADAVAAAASPAVASAAAQPAAALSGWGAPAAPSSSTGESSG